MLEKQGGWSGIITDSYLLKVDKGNRCKIYPKLTMTTQGQHQLILLWYPHW